MVGQGFASLTVLDVLDVLDDALLSLARHIAVTCMDGLVDERFKSRCFELFTTFHRQFEF